MFKETIYIVDDNISILKLIKRALDKEGYKVQCSENSLCSNESTSACPLWVLKAEVAFATLAWVGFLVGFLGGIRSRSEGPGESTMPRSRYAAVVGPELLC